jgi:hypothetical protein
MKNLLLITAIIFLSFNINAQPREEPEKVKSLRIAIFTEVLELTTTEAEKFWPLFNEFNETMREKKANLFKLRVRLAEDRLDLTEKEIEEKLDEIFDIEVEIANMQRDYMKKMMKVIPASKVVLLPKAETEFKKALLDQIRQKRGPR